MVDCMDSQVYSLFLARRLAAYVFMDMKLFYLSHLVVFTSTVAGWVYMALVCEFGKDEVIDLNHSINAYFVFLRALALDYLETSKNEILHS